jgi:predicted NUDIX family phosphoesterase
VLLLKGNNPDISVKSELKSGTLLTAQELKPFVEHMESWSQMVFKKLV